MKRGFYARSLWWGRKERRLLALRSRRSFEGKKGCSGKTTTTTTTTKQQLKGNPQKGSPTQKKSLLDKLKLVYSVKVKSFWTVNFE